MHRIKENDTNVPIPVIDSIFDDTFRLHYQAAKHTSVGGMNWGLIFTWHAIPESERKRRQYKDYLPVRYLHVQCICICVRLSFSICELSFLLECFYDFENYMIFVSAFIAFAFRT